MRTNFLSKIEIIAADLQTDLEKVVNCANLPKSTVHNLKCGRSPRGKTKNRLYAALVLNGWNSEWKSSG